MQWLMSSPRGIPVSLIVGVPDGARLLAWFVDDGSERDLTGYVAELLLDGLLAPEEPQAPPPDVDPGDDVPSVPVADLRWDGCVDEDLTLLLVEPGAGACEQLPAREVLSLVSVGIREALRKAVAADADAAPIPGGPDEDRSDPANGDPADGNPANGDPVGH